MNLKTFRLFSLIRSSVYWGASASGLLLAACSSGGGAGQELTLQGVSVSGNGEWELNRPILFTFSDDVDFSTVNMNTIHIGQTAGGPAVGEFALDPRDPRTVKFQPRCPTLPDNSDAGLLPGGVNYTIQIPGADSGAATVHSTSGGALGEGLTIRFNTVSSTDPADLFIDTALGPPNPVIRDPDDTDVTDATYIEIGEDPTNPVYFEPRPTPDPERGAQMPAGFTADLNLYSDVSSRIAILVAINQAVNSSADNVNVDNIRLEYRTSSVPPVWINMAHTVVLETNCLGTGARLRVTPTGILPQNHLVRVLLTRDFKDLVGDANLVSVVVGTFLVSTATDPGTDNPGAAADEILEGFSTGGTSPGSLEDSSSVGAAPPAEWGTDGLLKAGFAFAGTGGPDHIFDWVIGNDDEPSQSNHPVVLLDTSFSVIYNPDQTSSQTVINGVVDVKDFTVTASGTLSIQGPNPCTILVSGSARIDGEINLKGNSNLSVATLNTTNQPEPGGSGKAGGGRGGTGSYLTSQSTRVGGNGYGAFDAPDGGGVGGESAFNSNYVNDADDAHRRPGGGGGGTLGHDFLRPEGIVDNPNLCPDQAAVGYDAEQGFPGAPEATGALTGLTPPVGGNPGPHPFFNDNPNDDFWGTMLDNASGQLIQGELLRPWAGAGGGAGGNAIVSQSFPTTPFDIGGDEKGAGGGGGGGCLTIYALGSITFGPHGRINASGGTGGGGENSFANGDVTHIGGGSGGGSGGHIILQTASQIDLRALTTIPEGVQPAGGIFALGGNGGAGKNNLGGATPGGFPVGPQNDALPPNSYPVPPPPPDPPCPVGPSTGYSFTNTVGVNTDVNPFTGAPLVAICAGGDGGAGLIQFHTPLRSDILIPNTGTPVETIYSVVKPPPVGSFPGTGAPSYATINDPLQWNQMLPIFGRRSQGISKWIPLGSASVSPTGSATPDLVQFFFKGTDASGAIAAPGGQVAELTPILTGTIVAENTGSPVYPYIDSTDQRTIVFDSATVVDGDDIYLRNVALMKRFLIRFTHGLEITEYEVAFASYDPGAGVLRLTVDAGGQPLGGIQPGHEVEVRPRFFRVLTDDVPDSLPASSQIVAEFQATLPNPQGDPDLSQVSAWVTDIGAIDPNLPGNPDYKFFRFRISFDISVDDEPLTFDTPIPSLDFFRIPFRF